MRLKKNQGNMFRVGFVLTILMGMVACSDSLDSKRHYFLKGYDDLDFETTSGIKVSPQEFITPAGINGSHAYVVRDTSLTLVNQRNGKPYTGYIRTFYKNRYNIQGQFEGGKIKKLEFWFANRVKGMEAEYETNSGKIWNKSGQLVARWNEDEMHYLDAGTQTIREIREDSMTSYFDKDGNLERYTVYTDTMITNYYADGTPQFQYPAFSNGNGPIKRWYPNGQLKATGQYKNGEESGTWIEYDSLGNEIDRKVWD